VDNYYHRNDDGTKSNRSTMHQREYVHSYQESPNDVKAAFSNLIGRYNLVFRADGICSVDLEINTVE
jgi:hypothetical protein